MRFLLALSILFTASFCSIPDREITPAFYHWRTQFALSAQELTYLNQLNTNIVYVKFFDVDWDFIKQEAVPKASVQLDNSPKLPLEIIPTIFITNRTFKHLPKDEIPDLVEKITTKIENLGRNYQFKEIQIDCDWTQSTRIPYFTFLEQLKASWQAQNVSLSTTIRLHQFKYPEKTGIPPIDKGMLMVYNVGKLENWTEKNSILSIQNLQPYLVDFDEYALKLDIALPIFAWGVVYRGSKLIKLINNLHVEMLGDTSVIKEIGKNRFELTKSTYINGYYLYAGDRIRIESIDQELLNETATLLADYNPDQAFTLAFYHLDTSTIKHYQYEQLQQVISNFKH